jgi:hypothetical protein
MGLRCVSASAYFLQISGSCGGQAARKGASRRAGAKDGRQAGANPSSTGVLGVFPKVSSRCLPQRAKRMRARIWRDREGDDAASPRLFVVAPGSRSEGRRGLRRTERVNRALRACALSRLARGSCANHRTLETTGKLVAHSTLLCKNDRRW